MDLQMPEMGGLRSDQAIRERESGRAAGTLPIVALTAHAMQGDRERCLRPAWTAISRSRSTSTS